MSAPIFVFRHAESLANAEGLIVSDPRRAVGGYGLTERGRLQVAQAELPAELTAAGAHVLVVSSDFLRAAETATALQGRLPGARLAVDPGLRERNFALFEGQPHGHYHDVWALDEQGQDTPGVESVPDVWHRVQAVVHRYRREHPGVSLVLVSHGDVLQILLAGWRGQDPYRHRHQPHLGNAEFRRLVEA